MDSIKDVVRSSLKVPEFEKRLKNTGGHISRNVMEMTIKMNTIVRKLLMIKFLFSCLYNNIIHFDVFSETQPILEAKPGVSH